MRRISTPLFTVFAVLFSIAAFPQTLKLPWQVNVAWAYGTPTPETNITHGPVMVRDNFGNIYQATTPHMNTFQGDFMITKFNATLGARWSLFYTSAGLEDDEATAIAVDSQGDVIVTGTTQVDVWHGGPVTVATTVKYDPNGNQLWAVQNGGGFSTAPSCMTVDAAGDIYIGGTVADTSASPGDFFLLKLSAGGAQEWAVTYNGTAGRADKVAAIAADSAGNVYITGASMGQVTLRLPDGRTATFPQGYDIVTIKYNSGGQLMWNSRFASSGDDIPTAMALDAVGNVYVTGSSSGSGITICYNNAGSRQWVANSTSAQNYTSLALDPAGNIVTAGYVINSGLLNYVTTKYTAAGSLTWSSVAATGPYVALGYLPNLSMAIDRDANIYLAGEAVQSGTDSVQNLDFWTLKYASTGTQEWTRYFGSPGVGDVPFGITVIESSSPSPSTYPTIIVTGIMNIDPNDANSCTTALISYTQSIAKRLASDSAAETGDAEALGNSTLTAALSNYPNPFRGTTNIAYTLPRDGHVTLQVYDVTGSPIAILVNENETAGPHSVRFNSGRLAAGVYQYRIIAQSPQGDFVQTRQMLVL
jgi:hypothetical protein